MISAHLHDPWIIQENKFTPHRQHHRETIFTIGNGYLSTRGTFEERYPLDCQACLVHGVWDDVLIAFSELANLPDWTSFELWCNDVQFTMRAENILKYSRSLDLRTGCLKRILHWSPDIEKRVISLDFERFTSLADQHIACLKVEITPITDDVKVRIRASLDGHVENNSVLHWNLISQQTSHNEAHLMMKTRITGKIIAMSSQLEIVGRREKPTPCDSRGCPGVEIETDLKQGDTMTLVKYVSIATDQDAKDPLDITSKKIVAAAQIGYYQLLKQNIQKWKEFWQNSDVMIWGDQEAQIAIRHALFQLRIAAPAANEHVSIGAKTLSGFGYRGHIFWDTEIFILPLFTFTQPEISRNMLMYRYHTLPGARKKASRNGFRGAQYPWESAETGDEVTPTWVPDFRNPLELVRIWTGDIELHITTDIIYALHQYWQVTANDDFWINVGIPILFETALFWGERVESEGNAFAIRDVIGPDEYHEHVDNNVFTNYMVKWHLSLALKMRAWLEVEHPDELLNLEKRLEISSETTTHWADVRDNLIILSEPNSGLIEQFEGFFQLKEVEWSKYKNRRKSMQEILGIEGANQHQVIKQADVIMLLCLFRNDFDSKAWKINWDYYNPRTDHEFGSSLGPSMQAWAACEMGSPDLAYEHFMRAARADLFDVRGNANDGIHGASAGGLWQAIVFGFAGLSYRDNILTISPKLPHHWRKLSFSITYRKEQYRVEITPQHHLLTRLEPGEVIRSKLDEATINHEFLIS